jgi:hypothetical protein
VGDGFLEFGFGVPVLRGQPEVVDELFGGPEGRGSTHRRSSRMGSTALRQRPDTDLCRQLRR